VKAVIRGALVAALVWGLLALLARVLQVAPGWPLWAVAVVLALSVELILWLYGYEAGAVTARRARWLMGLRLAALAVLVWILIEPTWVRTVAREPQQELVVVLDDSASMGLVDEGEEASRIEIGLEALESSSALAELKGPLRVRSVRAARSVRGEGESGGAGWRESTDLAAALETVLEQVAPDELAGVLLVSDGRHNRPSRVEDVARRFGVLDAPVGVVAMGGDDPPRDAAVLSVAAPQAVHLGDRMRVRSELKFDGYQGETAVVRLVRDGEVLDEREVPIPQPRHREELSFSEIPEEGGVGGFRIEIAGLEGERFADNNSWEFETSITDARTNVLLLDRHPRWEFRYLRNLFHGRDKSIHLQWVLRQPDRIAGQEVRPVAASAARPFGEAQATELPASEEEWRKFDVIILGDLEPGALSEEQWRIVSRCVNERGALLVMIAGPESMPHALDAEAARSLVPVELEWGRQTYYAAGGEAFRVALSGAGEGHPVTQQVGGRQANAALWRQLPELRWRHPVESLKEGAEVLLVAADPGAGVRRDPVGLDAALEELAERRRREAERALLVTRQSGRGKVALWLSDRSWRWREGSGDVYHHRFWGNLMRWGAGPMLRAGGERARSGTDQLAYTPDDPVRIRARLRDERMNPLEIDGVQAEVRREGRVVATVPLERVEDSAGLYEGEAGPFDEAGRYEVRLLGVDGRADDAGRPRFRVVGSKGPVELSDTTRNLPLLQTIADLSGGRVVEAAAIDELASLFLGEREDREEIRETSLWDRAWVIGLFALLLGSEWVIRRGAGLP